MKRVLWLSDRHSPLPSQISELKRLFGDDVKVTVVIKRVENIRDITSSYKQNFCDEMVLLIPLSYIRQLSEFGYRPLYAEMRQILPGEEVEISFRGKAYKFIGFKRIEEVKLVFSDLDS